VGWGGVDDKDFEVLVGGWAVGWVTHGGSGWWVSCGGCGPCVEGDVARESVVRDDGEYI
jgi:hypothetical protein